MPAAIREWPAWPEFTAPDAKTVLAENGADALRQSWIKVCQELQAVTDEIVERRNKIIPIFDTAQILAEGFSDAQQVKIKRVGSFICRATISESETNILYEDMSRYVADNKQSIQAWPKDSPSMLIFPFLGLGPHIDAGSICRWADAAYRKVYEDVFQGRLDTRDSFDIGVRKNADPALYQAMAQWSVLRIFQGWTALTPTAPREGTIMPPKNKDVDVMDPHTWTLDDKTGWFPGTFKTQSQRLSRASHPHLRLEECLVPVPKVNAGDTVWWHCDVCHAVDTEHLGKVNAAVAFIGSCPTTPVNTDYVKRQLAATLEGRSPPDYALGGEADLDERKLKGYAGLEGLSSEARKAFRFQAS
ncbi:DUF1479-domain-containing protein [Setomelanomma holmii]|uniref:DUF1479-domain-containing protein n=1 Tax=Setomelanomma holmii TaxID=210430 RepID=A0A9P4GZQ6_9PLEO|nr:DUF1479-domain-containing protein [Setomelanomma holmii]